MTELIKTDNAHLGAKLMLRRYFLDKFHTGANAKPNVFDACQAEGVIWTHLRAEYPVRYFGVDRKAKKGRLAIDSARLLEFPDLPYDVVDIDTYGAPWRHWMNLLPNVRKPVTVFITMGAVSIRGGTNYETLRALGLSESQVQSMPTSLEGKLTNLAVDYCLGLCYNFSLTPHDAREVIGPRGSARYFGVHLIPKATSAPEKQDGRQQSDRMDA